MFESRISAGAPEKLPGWNSRKDGCMVLRHGRACSKMRWAILRTGKQKSGVQWELENLQVCSPIVLKCLYLARIGRPDILWSVNELARAVAKWTQSCDRRLARLISYIDHTNEFRQYCHVGNTAQHCRLGFSQVRICWRPWGLKIYIG